jgi:hypothetical protein
VNELREDLDRALRTVTFGEAPVEQAKRDGRRIRARRRVTLLVGALAVAAVAAGYPILARSGVAPPPTTLQTQVPHKSTAGHDPVITDGGPADASEAPGGLTTKTSMIAQGTVGDVKWQVSVQGPSPSNPVPADTCYTATLSPATVLADICDDPSVALAGALDGNPAAFSGEGDSHLEVTVGAVAPDVTYFIVTFDDGQQLKLIPVTVHGTRYIAWVAPTSMTIDLVVAHLGGPYSDSGQIMTTAPFDLPGQPPTFGLWQKSGQSAPPRDDRVIGNGSADGHPWSATAYEGPWGTCFVTSTGTTDCVPLSRLDTTSILGGWGGSSPEPVFGSAAPGTASVRVTLSNGKSVEVTPVGVGNENLFAFWVGKGIAPTGWAGYDASGHESGSGAVTQGSAPPASKSSR